MRGPDGQSENGANGEPIKQPGFHSASNADNITHSHALHCVSVRVCVKQTERERERVGEVFKRRTSFLPLSLPFFIPSFFWPFHFLLGFPAFPLITLHYSYELPTPSQSHSPPSPPLGLPTPSPASISARPHLHPSLPHTPPAHSKADSAEAKDVRRGVFIVFSSSLLSL